MNNSHYELLRELAGSPYWFTDQMRSEFSALREQLRNGTADSNFPWERYEELGFYELVSKLPANWRDVHKDLKQRLFEKGQKLHLDILRHNTIAITAANTSWHYSVGKQHQFKLKLLTQGLKQLERLEAFATEMFSGSADDKESSPWKPLLIGLLTLPELFEFFVECGLLTATHELTELGQASGNAKARKAPWAGTLQALMKSRHLDNNVAAICRALSNPAGNIRVSLNEGTLRDCSRQAGVYFGLANEKLEGRGILRK
jgi:hypothetical protein